MVSTATHRGKQNHTGEEPISTNGCMPGRPKRVRTVHLSDAEIDELLDRMDSREHDGPERRSAPRFRYRAKAVPLHIHQAGTTSSIVYLVPTRNISAEGMAFLHGGFIYTGTPCVLQLITTCGSWNNVLGSVISCRHVSANIHEVGLKFQRPIDPAHYCRAARNTRALLAEDSALMRKLGVTCLHQMGVKVDEAEDGQKALELAATREYEVVFLDMEMPLLDGFGVARELRQRGYTGRIVAVTALVSMVDRQRCLEAGCDQHLGKPYTRKQLTDIVESLHEEPLVSTLASDPVLGELIPAFVAGLPTISRTLEQAFLKEDRDAMLDLCKTLRGESGSFGFEIISEAAAIVEESLQNSAAFSEARVHFNKLLRLCSMAALGMRGKAS
ncbi:MAG: hypothetical protein AMXMBFR13_27060 [Phycisphaerae bacterium]